MPRVPRRFLPDSRPSRGQGLSSLDDEYGLGNQEEFMSHLFKKRTWWVRSQKFRVFGEIEELFGLRLISSMAKT